MKSKAAAGRGLLWSVGLGEAVLADLTVVLLGLFKVRDALGLFESVLVLLDRILAYEVEVLAGAQIGILETGVTRGRRDLALTRVLALVERRSSSASDHDYSRPTGLLVEVWLQ